MHRTGGIRLLIFPALACALFAASCIGSSAPQTGVVVQHEIEPQPPKVGPATLTLKLTDASAKPLSGARVTLESNMTHAGMPASFASAKEAEPGRYRATLDFTMAGDWFVLVHAALPDGREIERRLDVRGVRAN